MDVGRVAATAGLLLAALAGCAGEAPQSRGPAIDDAASVASAPPSAGGPTAVSVGNATATSDANGCRVARVRAAAGDLLLLSLGRDIYLRLDCTAPTPLKAQLAYLRGVPDVAQQAVQARATFSFDAAGDGAGMRIYSDQGTCVVTVSDNPKTKLLTCG